MNFFESSIFVLAALVFGCMLFVSVIVGILLSSWIERSSKKMGSDDDHSEWAEFNPAATKKEK